MPCRSWARKEWHIEISSSFVRGGWWGRDVGEGEEERRRVRRGRGWVGVEGDWVNSFPSAASAVSSSSSASSSTLQ